MRFINQLITEGWGHIVYISLNESGIILIPKKTTALLFVPAPLKPGSTRNGNGEAT